MIILDIAKIINKEKNGALETKKYIDNLQEYTKRILYKRWFNEANELDK